MRNRIWFMAVLVPLLCAIAPPLPADQPLPDITTLLKQVQENQKRVEPNREKYSFTDVEEQDDVARDGRVKKTMVNQYDVFFLHGYLIRRRVKKGGRPLSASEQRKEDGRVKKLIERDQRREQKKDHAEGNQITIETFLKASRFTHPRWETLRGRRVLVFDFEPNPDFRPKTVAERIAHSLGGDVCIDAQAREVVWLKAWFDRPYKIGGGLLASLQKGTSVAAGQMLVGGDAWLPSYTSIHASVRLLLFKGVRLNVEDHFSDYRVFHVESLSKIAKPSEAKR